MNSLPQAGYLRLPQILGDAKRGIPALIPVSASTWWEGVRTGLYPAGVKISARATGWRCEDIRKLLADGVGTAKTGD